MGIHSEYFRIAPPYQSEDGNTYTTPFLDENGEHALKHHDLSADTLDLSMILTANTFMRAGAHLGLGLGQVLRQNSTLHTLNLSGCPLNPQAVPQICEALVFNTTLQKLTLRYTSAEGNSIRALARALIAQPSLTSLDLRGISKMIIGTPHQFNFGAIMATELSMALTSNTTLDELDLSDNCIAEEGGVALGTALKVNTALMTLHLEQNMLGTGGVEAIGEALQTNSTLTFLNLKDTRGMEEPAFASLARALSVNSTLRTLSLMDSEVDNEERCTLLIAQAMASNSTLTSLEIGYRHWPVPHETMSVLARSIITNTALTQLDVGTYQLNETSEEKTALEAIVARNANNLGQKTVSLTQLLLTKVQ